MQNEIPSRPWCLVGRSSIGELALHHRLGFGWWPLDRSNWPACDGLASCVRCSSILRHVHARRLNFSWWPIRLDEQSFRQISIFVPVDFWGCGRRRDHTCLGVSTDSDPSWSFLRLFYRMLLGRAPLDYLSTTIRPLRVHGASTIPPRSGLSDKPFRAANDHCPSPPHPSFRTKRSESA